MDKGIILMGEAANQYITFRYIELGCVIAFMVAFFVSGYLIYKQIVKTSLKQMKKKVKVIIEYDDKGLSKKKWFKVNAESIKYCLDTFYAGIVKFEVTERK